jgi:hypothetical protein
MAKYWHILSPTRPYANLTHDANARMVLAENLPAAAPPVVDSAAAPVSANGKAADDRSRAAVDSPPAKPPPLTGRDATSPVPAGGAQDSTAPASVQADATTSSSPSPPGGPVTGAPPLPSAAEQALWNLVQDSDDLNDFQLYLKQYPNGAFSDLARSRMSALASPDWLTLLECDPNRVVKGPDGEPAHVKCDTAGLNSEPKPKYFAPFLPAPMPSEQMHLPHQLFVANTNALPSLIDVARRLTQALDAAGYSEFGFYKANNGFGIVSRMEQFNEDGSPALTDARFLPPDVSAPFSLTDYLRQLFVAPEGLYRVIAFVVTDVPIGRDARPADVEAAERWGLGGDDRLSPDTSPLFTSQFEVSVLIYEFQKRGNVDVTPLLPGRLDVRTHLQRSKIYQFLTDSNR